MNAYLFYLLLIYGTFFLAKLISGNERVVITLGRYPVVRNKNIRDIISIMFISLPIIFVLSNRYNVGTDFDNYLRMYNDYNSYGIYNYEWGTLAVFKLANLLKIKYKGVLFLFSVIGFGLASQFIKLHSSGKAYPLSILFYLFLYFGPLCNIMAQTAAVSFLVVAYYGMKEQKVILTIASIVLATLFHASSIVMIVVYCLYAFDQKNKIRFVSVIVIIFSIIILISPSVLTKILNIVGFTNYLIYLDYNSIRTFLYLLIYRVPLYIIELFYKKSLIAKDNNNSFYYWLLLLEFICGVIGIRFGWIGRLMYSFSIVHVFLDAQIITTQENRKDRIALSLLIIICYTITFWFTHFFSEFDGIMSFQFM